MDLGDNRHKNFEEKAENEDFFTILTKCTVIIYVEISFHITVPLNMIISGKQFISNTMLIELGNEVVNKCLTFY